MMSSLPLESTTRPSLHLGRPQQLSRAIDELSVPISQEDSLVCNVCRARFDNRSGLRYSTAYERERIIDKRLTRSRHHLETHTDKARRYPCKQVDCNSAFRYPKDLERHMRTHNKVSPFLCEEAGCDRGFSRRDYLSRHLRDKHAGSTTAQAILTASSTAYRHPRRVQTSSAGLQPTVSGASATTTSSNAGIIASHSETETLSEGGTDPTSFLATQTVPSLASETTQPDWED